MWKIYRHEDGKKMQEACYEGITSHNAHCFFRDVVSKEAAKRNSQSTSAVAIQCNDRINYRCSVFLPNSTTIAVEFTLEWEHPEDGE